jgi:hypothetical protein
VTTQKDVDELAKVVAKKTAGDAVVWFALSQRHLQEVQERNQSLRDWQPRARGGGFEACADGGDR